MNARLLVALYVALALHGLLALALLLAPDAQSGAGAGQDLGIGLSLEGQDSVFATAPSMVDPRSSVARVAAVDAITVANPPKSSGETTDQTALTPGSRDAQQQRSGSDAAAARAGGGGMDGYFALLRRHLHRFRRELPAHVGLARATVGFEVSADGTLGSVELVQSSGLSVFDEEAIALVRRAAPLPRPPTGQATRLVVPIAIEPP